LSKIKKMKKILFFVILLFFIPNCTGSGSKGLLGTGVSIATDPRSLGTQIDDSIMEKNLKGRLILFDKKYFLDIKAEVIDGRIFITGKVDKAEEKLKITKMAWETKGVRSVKNDLKIKEKFDIKTSAKDLLISSQLRSALFFNKKIKAGNYRVDVHKKKIFIYGIASDNDERKEVINEAKQILDVEDIVVSIFLIEDLRIQQD